MEMIARISRGSVMDQIYLPRSRRPGFTPGVFVRIALLEGAAQERPRPYFRDCPLLEPWKISILEQVFAQLTVGENALVTGSFLEQGHDFADIDVVLIARAPMKEKEMEQRLHAAIGLPFHVIALSYGALREGARTDPLFQMMLSRFVARKTPPASLFGQRREYRYKLLDLHLLESKPLLDSFDYLGGREKYKLLRNMIAILLFLEGKRITAGAADAEIRKRFGSDARKNLMANTLERQPFLKRCMALYRGLFNRIMEGVHAEEQKRAD